MKQLSLILTIRRIVTILLLLILTINTLAQSVRGRVSSSEDNLPLPGVNVMIKGTTNGTITDLEGNYSININSDEDILVFSFIGMKTQEITVRNQTKIDVILEPAESNLEEIVIIGYGKVKKSDLTGAVSSVKTEELMKITSLNPAQGLQGKVAGVMVSSTSGAPGANPVIRIRGVGTFNNNAPIFVVDGIILNDISFLNSADIASMEVLKDASATSIYGSRGSNGVFIITTKSGNAGQKGLAINYSGEFGMQLLSKKIDLLNGREFAIISNEIRPGSYNNIDAVPNTDWQDLVFSPAPQYFHQLSVAGTTEKSQFYFGLSYFEQQGVIDKSNYQRISLKLNNTYNLAHFFKLGNNITVSPYNQRINPNVTYSVYRAQPVLEPYYSDGSYGVVHNVGNPLADLEYSNNFNEGIRAVGNLFAEANFFDALTLKTSFGIDGSYNNAKNFTPAYTVYNPDGTASQQTNEKSSLFKGNSQALTWLWENTISYNKTFNKHSIDVVVGYTMQNTSSENMGITGLNLLRDYEDFWYINPSNVYDPNNNVNTVPSIYNNVDNNNYYSMISYLGRVNYLFNNRYIVTATFRRDGSSKFIKTNRYSNFPSFAVGWNISNESFMDNISALSNLKLRASWGIIGNEKIQYLNQYSVIVNDLTILGVPEKANNAATYSVNGNSNLKWESTTQKDIGIEFELFDNKLSTELDFYQRETEDILVGLGVPGYQGNGQGARITYNAGSVLNRGFEANIAWKQKLKNLSYSVGFIASAIHNEVLSVGGNSGIDSVLIGGYLKDGRPVTQSREGLPIGAFYGYKTDGIFQNQGELDAYPHSSQAGVGDLRFVDVNNDGKIDGNDRTYLGSPIPTFIFGINFTMEYKSFDFSLDMQGQSGNKIFNAKEVVRPDPYNFEKHVFERWTGPETSTTEPRPSFGGYNYTPSDRFIQDGSFLRLRTVMLAYTFRQSFTQNIHIQKFRIYIKGNNLFTFTKFTGYTPEIASQDALSNSIDHGTYPVTAIYSMGLNLTF